MTNDTKNRGRKLVIENIPVVVIRKNVRRMNLHVTPTRIWMSIPQDATDAQAKQFVMANLVWIRKHQGKVQERCTQQRDTMFRLWGKPVEIKTGTQHAIYREDDVLFLPMGAENLESCERQLSTWLAQELLRRIEVIAPTWEALVGAKPQSYYVRNTKTIWGSCSLKTRRICLNLQLVHEAPAWLDYILVHELTHLLIANHSSDFWAKVDSFYPNWRIVRQQMRN